MNFDFPNYEEEKEENNYVLRDETQLITIAL